MCDADFYTLADVVYALVPLTGLAELKVYLPDTVSHRAIIEDLEELEERAVVPAALGRLKALRSLQLHGSEECVLKPGCLNLPNLLSLELLGWDFKNAEVLRGASALQSLTRIEFSGGDGPRFFDRQLVALPRLQHVIYQTLAPCHGGACSWLSELPADMGALRSTLQHIDCRGHALTHFPLALTQLAALECLRATDNDFAELPAAVTALSRLTELRLGRRMTSMDPFQLHERRRLDVRALGDLSGFPALCTLSFDSCEVVLCKSMQGASRHARLTSLSFRLAHPAPECGPAVLQLSQALRQLGRGSVLKLASDAYGLPNYWLQSGLESAQGRAPFQAFRAALEASGL